MLNFISKSDIYETSHSFITTETEPKFPLAVVIGGSCGGLFLVGLAICLVVRYQPCKRARQRSLWQEMPRDDLYPGSSEYELEDRRESIRYYGEITPLHTGARSVGLGHTNEAARYEDL